MRLNDTPVSTTHMHDPAYGAFAPLSYRALSYHGHHTHARSGVLCLCPPIPLVTMGNTHMHDPFLLCVPIHYVRLLNRCCLCLVSAICFSCVAPYNTHGSLVIILA